MNLFQMFDIVRNVDNTYNSSFTCFYWQGWRGWCHDSECCWWSGNSRLASRGQARLEKNSELLTMMREGCRWADMNLPPWEIDTPTSHHHTRTRDQCTLKNHADISKMSFSTHPLLSGLLHGAGAVSPGLVSDVSMSGSISVQCFGLLLTTRRLES